MNGNKELESETVDLACPELAMARERIRALEQKVEELEEHARNALLGDNKNESVGNGKSERK